MIHEIGKDLQAELVEHGCPFKVVDGPERTTTITWGRERIVIQYDDDTAEKFSDGRGQNQNAKPRLNRGQTAKITIYAQSNRDGAMEWEHRRRASLVLDCVLVGLGNVAEARKNKWAPVSGRFVKIADLAKGELDAGAVYELKFTFDRGVAVRDWKGEANPEASFAGVVSTTKVNGVASGDTPETACGA